MQTEQILADLQRQYMDDDALVQERQKIHESWFDETTVDFWRHKRMYATIAPVANHFKKSSWLTIGDGRFGLDTVRLKKLFDIESILPTDIAENMLESSKKMGMIDQYSVENAERLSFADNSFDVVFCKEAFHHFPRPYIALYEMLRVSRKAVILVEPSDRSYLQGVKAKDYLTSAFKLLLSKITGKPYYPYVPDNNQLIHSFEEAGNYLYAVSVREMEKIVHGMNLANMAYYKFNDVYIKGCEFEKCVDGNPVFEEMKRLISNADEKCKAFPQFNHPNMVTTIIFKDKVDASLEKAMKDFNYNFINKVANPYLSTK